jgi:hypothetical protein
MSVEMTVITPRTKRLRAGAPPKDRLELVAQRSLGPPPFLDLLDEDGAPSLDRAAEAFGLTKAQLAETAGLQREAIYRATRLRALKTQARLREMIEIIARVSDWAGGPIQAMAWYRAQPIAAFGGRTAEALVKSGQAAPLRDYLDHIAAGGHA